MCFQSFRSEQAEGGQTLLDLPAFTCARAIAVRGGNAAVTFRILAGNASPLHIQCKDFGLVDFAQH
jgi:hypothetical protein